MALTAGLMNGMIDDLRYAVRTLARSRLYAASAILTLSLGIGANAAVFAVVRAVLLDPLPYPQPDRLVRIWETNPAQGVARGDVSPGSYAAWRDRSAVFERVGLYLGTRDWLLTFGGVPQSIRGSTFTPGLFDVLGVPPLLGRTFLRERQDVPVADASEIVLGYGVWQRHFGGSRDAIGSTILLEGRAPLTIVGVMPPGFDFPGGVDAWRQERFDRAVSPSQRLFRNYQAVGRLAPGQPLDAARAELTTIAAALTKEFPASHAGYGVFLTTLDESIVGDVETPLVVLVCVVGLVLLIACANVTHLMLARASARRRDLAVRVALGASRPQILRHLLCEAVVIAGMGGALALGVGYLGMRLLVALAPADVPRTTGIRFDGWVLAFTGLVSLATAFAASVLPAVHSRGRSLLDALRTSRTATLPGSRARRVLMTVQVALALTLLVGAALLLRSFATLRGVDLGFSSRDIVTADLRLPTSRFQQVGRRPWFALAEHYERLLADLRALPGVESIAGITGMPLAGEGSSGIFWIGDGNSARPDASRQFTAAINIITPAYLETMGIARLRGRGFTASDRLDATALLQPADLEQARPRGVVMVNRALAERFFPGQDAIGRSIVLLDHWAVSSSTIVGIVADVRAEAVSLAAAPAVYVPWGEIPGFRLSIAARLGTAKNDVAPSIRARIAQFDPQLLVSPIRPMTAVVDGAIATPRFHLVLLASFAVLALTLAALGIYGVVAYLVVQRTRELGIRVSLGATRRHVLQLIAYEGLIPVLYGAAAGIVLAASGARLMRALLFGVAPLDPASFVFATVVLLVVASAAIAIPGLRAARVDPIVVLRDD